MFWIMDCALGAISKKSLPNPRSQRFSPLFSSLYVFQIYSQRNGKLCVSKGFWFLLFKVLSPRPLAYPAFTNEACLLSAVTVYNLEKEQFCFVYFSGGNLVGLWIAQHLNSLSVWEKSQDI